VHLRLWKALTMDRTVILFLKASLAWLVAGVTLGVGMALAPSLMAYRPAHIHMLLLGFVTGTIFGVGYHVFPRFAGRPLHGPRLVMPHWWLANIGVGAMAAAFVLRAEGVAGAGGLLGAGGSAAAAGAYLFAYNVWRTLSAAAAPRPAPPTRAGALPLMGR
jgi:cbb3-type cytochrome oxidase subunit 1